jgi:hypothetical protein
MRKVVFLFTFVQVSFNTRLKQRQLGSKICFCI